MELLTNPDVWASLATLTILEIVLGIDNVIFIALLVQRLPVEQQARARVLGLGGALIMRVLLLFAIVWLTRLTKPLFDLAGNTFSWRDLILIGGGLFLVWKATREIHHNVDPEPSADSLGEAAAVGFGVAIVQILMLDLVFSLDSIITAVGMTDDLPIMVIAVVVAVLLMLLAADPLARFIGNNPTIVMLALGFLLMIGATLLAEGVGAHVPKGYIYAAMAFSALIEGLNMMYRRAQNKG